MFYEIDGLIPRVSETAFVDPSASIIGDVHIGDNVYIGPGAVLRGDLGRIIIESNANLQDLVVLHGWPTLDTIIKSYGHVGHSSVIHGATICEGALIGMGAIVLDGAQVSKYSWLAAGSVLLSGKITNENSLYAGVPAKFVKMLTPEHIRKKHYGTEQYIKLAKRYKKSFKQVIPLDNSRDKQALRVQDIYPEYTDWSPN